MSWNVDVDRVLRLLVDNMLPRFSGPEKGLLVSLDLSMRNYLADGVLSESKSVLLVYQRPDNYTKVFMAQPEIGSTRSMLEGLTSEDWILLCDHDSCWSSAIDTPLNKFYNRMFDSVFLEGDGQFKPVPHCSVRNLYEVSVKVSRNLRSDHPQKRYLLEKVDCG